MVLWNLAQQMQLRTARNSQALSDREHYARDQRQDARADELEHELQQVLFVTEALWNLCRDRLGVTEDDLKAAMQQVVDQHEAAAKAGPLTCASCGAAVPRDMFRCQYCGTDTGQVPELFR